MIDEIPGKINNSLIKDRLQKEQQTNSIAKCPSCKDGHIKDKGKFYGCDNYQSGCSFTLPKKIAGKSISKTNVQKLLDKNATNLIKGFKSKKGKSFNAYIVWENKQKGKIAFEFNKQH